MQIVENSGSCARFAPTNYPQLQNLLRKDPLNYYDEFLQQERHFNSLLSLHLNNTQDQPSMFAPHIPVITSISSSTSSFSPLVNFLAHTSGCYESKGGHLSSFINQLIRLVKISIKSNDSTLCRSLILALIVARHKCTNFDVVLLVIESFFEISSFIPDLVYNHLIQESKQLSKFPLIKKLFKEKITHILDFASSKTNTCSNTLFILRIAIEMFNSNAWRDLEIVRLITGCCYDPSALSSNSKISLLAINFFLGNICKAESSDSSLYDAQEALDSIKHSLQVSGKNRSKLRKEKKAKRKLVNSKIPDEDLNSDGEEKKSNSLSINFIAMDLLSDPHDFCEKMDILVSAKDLSYEHRISSIRLQSLLISHHKLHIDSFYERILRYLKPTQKECTRILAYAANAIHSDIPLEEVEKCNGFSIIQTLTSTIARNFVSEHCRPEVITVGLNTLREIATRLPVAIPKEVLEQILIFSTPKASSAGISKASTHNKGVLMAAKSLLSVYRSTAPLLLSPRLRGRPTQVSKTIERQDLTGQSESANENGSEESSSDEVEELISEEDISEIENSDNSISDCEEEESTDPSSSKSQIIPPDLSSAMYTRFLSTEELCQLNELKAKVEEGAEVSIDCIQRGVRPGGKPSKEERLKSVLAGREGKDYGRKHHASDAKRKKRTKSFMMMIHKRGGRFTKDIHKKGQTKSKKPKY